MVDRSYTMKPYIGHTRGLNCDTGRNGMKLKFLLTYTTGACHCGITLNYISPADSTGYTHSLFLNFIRLSSRLLHHLQVYAVEVCLNPLRLSLVRLIMDVKLYIYDLSGVSDCCTFMVNQRAC